jgi:hypothetical protein
MQSGDELAHHLAAGFLEKASLYAATHGQDNLHTAMERALAGLMEEFRSRPVGATDPSPEREAVYRACQIARLTLGADRRRVN